MHLPCQNISSASTIKHPWNTRSFASTTDFLYDGMKMILVLDERMLKLGQHEPFAYSHTVNTWRAGYKCWGFFCRVHINIFSLSSIFLPLSRNRVTAFSSHFIPKHTAISQMTMPSNGSWSMLGLDEFSWTLKPFLTIKYYFIKLSVSRRNGLYSWKTCGAQEHSSLLLQVITMGQWKEPWVRRRKEIQESK